MDQTDLSCDKKQRYVVNPFYCTISIFKMQPTEKNVPLKGVSNDMNISARIINQEFEMHVGQECILHALSSQFIILNI